MRIPRDANSGQPDTSYVDTVLGSETTFYRFEIEPGSEVRGEVIIVGDAGNEGRSVCPGVFLTDEDDKNYENAPFRGADSTETYIKNTDPVDVDVDEVWIKIELTDCLGETGREAQQFHVELRLAIVN